MKTDGNLLLEMNGKFIDEAEIKNPDGSHLKIKLKGNNVLVRVLNRGAHNQPSSCWQLVLPGQPFPKSHSEPTLLMLLQPQDGKLSVSAKVIVTWAFTPLITARLEAMVGDLSEEYAERRERLCKTKALIWILTQSLSSIVPLIWQIARYDSCAGVTAWKTWRSFS
jgi:hypothetical protein